MAKFAILMIGNMIGFSWLHLIIGETPLSAVFPIVFLQIVGLVYGKIED